MDASDRICVNFLSYLRTKFKVNRNFVLLLYLQFSVSKIVTISLALTSDPCSIALTLFHCYVSLSFYVPPFA